VLPEAKLANLLLWQPVAMLAAVLVAAALVNLLRVVRLETTTLVAPAMSEAGVSHGIAPISLSILLAVGIRLQESPFLRHVVWFRIPVPVW
jgi:hypothetical protein